MIRINLLGVERAKVRKKVAFQIGQKLTLACTLVLIVTALFVGWRYWTLTKQSSAIDADIAKAQSEASRLHSIIIQVQQFEQQKAQLQQRVQLIEQLRREQTGPVHMLDEISRALPDRLWLTDLKQTGTGTDVIIEGKCLNETIVSDFVANLEATGYFKRSIEITGTSTEPAQTPSGQLVKFSLKATFQPPGDAAKPAADAAAVKPRATN